MYLNIQESKYRTFFNKILFFGLVLLLGYTVGSGTIRILSDFSLGGVFRNYLPAGLVGVFMYFAVIGSDKGVLHTILEKPIFSPRNVVTGIILAIAVGFSVPYFSEFGLLYVPLGIMLICAYICACYCFFIEKELVGIIIFFLSKPFIMLFEWDFHSFFFDKDFNFRTFFWIPYSPTTIFLYSIFIIWLFLFIIKKKSFIPSKLYIVMGLFLFIQLVSTIYNDNQNKVLFVELASISIIPFLLLFMLINIIKSWDDVQKIIKSIFYYAIISVFISLYLHYRIMGIGFLTSFELYGKSYMSGLSPGGRATLLALSLPLGICIALSLEKGITKTANYFLVGIGSLILLLTAIRAAIMAFFVSLIPFMKLRRLLFFCLFVSGLYFISGGFFLRVFERIPDVKTLAYSGFEVLSKYRFLAWEASIEIIKDNPIIGIGYNQFGKAWFDYGYGIPISYRGGQTIDWNMGNTHNLYFEVAVASGILGLSALMAVIYYIVILINRSFKKKLNTTQWNIRLGLLSCFIVIFVVSFFGSIFFTPDVFLNQNYLFFALLSLLVVIDRLIQGKVE